MARKKIREYDAKKIICNHLPSLSFNSVLVTPETEMSLLVKEYPWLEKERLVAKPDHCFGQRKKLGLVLIDARFSEVKKWIFEKMNQQCIVGKAKGKLTHFLIEPFIPHQQEYYLSIVSQRESDVIYFSDQGGIDIEENWDKVKTLEVPILSNFEDLDDSKKEALSSDKKIVSFIQQALSIFRKLDFTYLELNPFTVLDEKIYLLDTVAVVDDCASALHQETGEEIVFPEEFGRQRYHEEEAVEELDKNSGASLKLTILNPQGKIWNILGGGGASIIYLDMIANIGQGKEMANYGEMSGNPSTEESYQYAKKIIELMLKNSGKILFIVGGIANFTDVRDTFKGVGKALEEYGQELKKNEIKIFVRRGGPHYEEGLNIMKEAVEKIGISYEIHGPETSMPRIIQIAKEDISK